MPSAITKQQKAKFLAKLRSSYGSVSKAAQAGGFSRAGAYVLKNKDADFSAAWEDVLASIYDEGEAELYRRAVIGYKDKDGIKRKSDRLLEFFLKGNRAEKYRDRMDLNAHHTGSLDVNIQASIDSIYGSDSNSAQIAGFDPAVDPDGEDGGDTESES